MPVSTGIEKPEIIEGSMVVIDTCQADEDVANRARRYHKSYARLYPFRVKKRTDSHVVLEILDGKVVHFGSVESAEFAICYVKLSI